MEGREGVSPPQGPFLKSLGLAVAPAERLLSGVRAPGVPTPPLPLGLAVCGHPLPRPPLGCMCRGVTCARGPRLRGDGSLRVGRESHLPSREPPVSRLLVLLPLCPSLSPRPGPGLSLPQPRAQVAVPRGTRVGSPGRGTRDATCPTCTARTHPMCAQGPARPLALPSPWEASGRKKLPKPRGQAGCCPGRRRPDGAGSGPYLEQPESGHPANAALLVLRAQHTQLLCLLQHFVRLLKEVKEDVVSVPQPISSPPAARAGLQGH